MAFARINGVVASVEAESSERAMRATGTVERGAEGNAVDGRRSMQRRFRLSLTTLPIEEATSLALLVSGLAHVFSFDGGIHSSTSIGPTVAGHDAHLAPGAGWAGDALVVRSGGTISFDAQLDDEWTVLVRFRNTGAGAPWAYGARTHDGREWIDGVEGVTGLANLVAVSAAGVVSLRGVNRAGANANITFDELVILPWRMADAHILDALAWEQSWGAAPEVHLVGDIVEPPLGIYCKGKADEASVVPRGSGRSMRGTGLGPRPLAPFAIDDNFLNNAQRQDLELEETTRPASLDVLPLPLLYFPISQAFGAVTVNERVFGNDATAAAALTFTSGPDGRPSSAATMTGIGTDRISRAGSEGSANGLAGLLTVSGWFKPTALVAQTLWSKWTEGVNLREWRVSMTAAGAVSVQISDAAGLVNETYTTPVALLVGAWSFISFDYSAARGALARVRVFIDGRPVGFAALAGVGVFAQMTTTGGVLHVAGQSNPVQGLRGQIATWACWSARALTTDEQRIAYLLARRGHPLRIA